MIELSILPRYPQRQDDLVAQLADLIMVANRFGMYDAADAIKQIYNNPQSVKYGCHVDLADDEQPDGCVINSGEIHGYCIYAKMYTRPEQCPYWKPIVKS